MIKALIISDFRGFHTARPEAEIFLGLTRLGVQIEVVTPTGSEYARLLAQLGVAVHDSYPQSKFDKEAITRIRKILVEGSFDILHLLTRNAITCGIRAAKGIPVKIITYRGTTRKIRWYKPSEYQKYLHPRVDRIACNAQAVQDVFYRIPFFDKNKTAVIPKGHLVEWYSNTEPTDLKSLGIPDNAITVACVANFIRVKDIPTLLQAINLLDNKPEIHFLLMGKGMDQERIVPLVKASRIADRVHAVGEVQNPLPNVAACDLLVLPSLREALTKAVIEAMSLGTVPVITDVAGNAELVVDGKNGLKVPRRDPKAMAAAIMHLAENEELRNSMAREAPMHIRKHVNHHDTVKLMLELYQSLVED